MKRGTLHYLSQDLVHCVIWRRETHTLLSLWGRLARQEEP
jgi:hypothetical protein